MTLPSMKSLNVPMAIFMIVMSLLVIGLISVYSASGTLSGREERIKAQRQGQPLSDSQFHAAGYLKKQAVWAVLGTAALFFFYRLDYHRMKRWSFFIMVACFIGCCLVWVPGVGYESNGSRRWIRLGPGGLQPSEFAKLGLIIYMAKMLDDRHNRIREFFSGVLPALIVSGAFLVIIVLEPDFGAAFVLGLVLFGMWLCGEMRWFHLFSLASMAIPAAVIAFLLEPYRIRRLMAFLFDDPETMMKEGFQLHQSLIAVGSGGELGLGLGNSIQKYHYLSAGHTDFIFSIVGEEMGFVGTTLVVMLFAALVMLGWWVVLNTSDLFGSLLATGITLLIFLGASINMCVVLGLLPTKGLVLPFLSSGGSSLLVSMAAMGMLMNVAERQFSILSRPVTASPTRRTLAREFI